MLESVLECQAMLCDMCIKVGCIQQLAQHVIPLLNVHVSNVGAA